MASSIMAFVVLGFIALGLAIIALLYIIVYSRKKTIILKKVDYLIEDITYKSEMLTSTVETVSKISNYIDIFETITRKNIKSAARLISRNKDDIYKIAERIKNMALGEKETKKGGK